MRELFTGQWWKLAFGLAALTSVVIGVLLVKSQIENRVIVADKQKLERQITDPKTGYIARLTQAQANNVVLEHSVATQNAAMKKLKDDSAAKLLETQRQLAAVQAENRDIMAKMHQFMAQKPRGATVEERVVDVDKRFLETLK